MRKRRFWQIHLLSAIWLTLSAGALIGLNLRETRETLSLFRPERDGVQYFGWPYPACYRQIKFSELPPALPEDEYHAALLKLPYEPSGFFVWIWDDGGDFDFYGLRLASPWRPWRSWFLIDVFTAGALMFLPVLALEIYWRRRSKAAAAIPSPATQKAGSN